MAQRKKGSCLLAFGTMLLFASLFATFLMFCVMFFWNLSPQDLSSRNNAMVVPIVFMLSVCGGLGGGILVYALTGKAALAREQDESDPE